MTMREVAALAEATGELIKEAAEPLRAKIMELEKRVGELEAMLEMVLEDQAQEDKTS